MEETWRRKGVESRRQPHDSFCRPSWFVFNHCFADTVSATGPDPSSSSSSGAGAPRLKGYT
eukprot:1030427-Rhodomonas_salina.1